MWKPLQLRDGARSRSGDLRLRLRKGLGTHDGDVVPRSCRQVLPLGTLARQALLLALDGGRPREAMWKRRKGGVVSRGRAAGRGATVLLATWSSLGVGVEGGVGVVACEV